MTAESFARARDLFLEGTRHLEAGRWAAAESALLASLALVPARPSTLVNLGAARIELGKPQEALEALDEALAAAPDDIDAWFRRGQALQALARLDEALACFEKAVAIDPTLAPAWSRRGGILKDLRRFDEAAVCFRHAIAHGADPELNGYYLATVSGRDAPAAAPRHYVQRLFDDYADEFDEHLLGPLHYQAHTVLARHLERLAARRFASALDLGCGTGLCGPLVKPLVDRLDGVDLSRKMLDKAVARGVYDHVVQAELGAHLQSTDRRYDLVVSADVFIYIGDLASVFGGARRVMTPGGLFCFSVELAEGGQNFELTRHSRYAHSEPYLRDLARRHGFDVVELLGHTVREDQCQPIAGLFAYLARR